MSFAPVNIMATARMSDSWRLRLRRWWTANSRDCATE